MRSFSLHPTRLYLLGHTCLAATLAVTCADSGPQGRRLTRLECTAPFYYPAVDQTMTVVCGEFWEPLSGSLERPTWSSSDTNIVRIDTSVSTNDVLEATVTAKRAGLADIRGTVRAIADSFRLTVLASGGPRLEVRVQTLPFAVGQVRCVPEFFEVTPVDGDGTPGKRLEERDLDIEFPAGENVVRRGIVDCGVESRVLRLAIVAVAPGTATFIIRYEGVSAKVDVTVTP